MGWRSAKGQVAAGTYDNPGIDKGGSFAEGFASTFVPMFSSAVSDYASEQKEKRMLEMKESLLRQRPRAASTTVSDRADQKSLREITALATELGITPTEAAGLYDAADQNASKAIENYNDGLNQGLLVTPMRPAPGTETVVPSTTDDLSSTEPPTDPDAAVVQLSEASVDEVTPAPVVETAATEEPVEPNLAFQPFEVASLGTIKDDLSLLTDTGESSDETTTRIAGQIDEEIQVADASGSTPTLTYREVLTSGATPTQTRDILAAGTRIPGIYAIPPVTEITTIEEANAALDVLNARSKFIGKAEGQDFADQYEADVRPMLEARIRSLTQLPDLGKMLEENSVDTLREFYENGYMAYEGRVDPTQLNAHRERAGVLLNSSSAYPPIPGDLPSLIELRNRVTSGDLKDAPTEWLETLNKNIFREEGVQRFGNRLTPDYIMSDDRSPRELETLREAAVFYLGGRDPIIKEIDIALGSPVPEAMPDMLEVTSTNYPTYAAQARRLGDVELADAIDKVGEIYVALAEEGIDITAITASNWPTYLLAAEQAGNTELASKIAELGATYDSRAAKDELPKISDVRAENWRSLRDAAIEAGDEAQAQRITLLGKEWEAASAAGDTSTLDNLETLSSVVTKFQDEEVEVDAQVRSYLGAVESSYALSQILQQNPDILRVAGGRLPALIKGVVGEISVLSSLLSGADSSVDGDVALRSVSAYENSVQQAFADGKLDAPERAYAMFRAQEIRLAFQIARMQQGSAGVISNADFDSALTSIRSSNDPNTWADSIRGLVVRDEVKVKSTIRDFSDLTNVKLAVQMQEAVGMSGLVDARSLQDRVADAGIADAYEWLTSGNPLITAQPVTPVTPEPVDPFILAIQTMTGQELQSAYLNEEGAWDFSNTTPEEKRAIRERLDSLRGDN